MNRSIAGIVGARRRSRFSAVAAASAAPFTPSSFDRAASGWPMASTSPAITCRRVRSSAGNEHDPADHFGPSPPLRFPSEGGSRITGVVAMAAILPQVVERGPR
ncbi:MAG: hypothetical protein EBX39_12880 [Actinobacteria bacterium]|nr:hypothetical protein [Actinomycetota bacterium]